MTWIEIIAEFLIPLILAVITYQIIPILKDKRAYSIAVTACRAVEQLWNSGRYSGFGAVQKS